MYSDIDIYYLRIKDLRDQVINLIDGLQVEALNWRPKLNVDEDNEIINSIAVLAAHIAGSELYWISEIVGKNPPTRDRNEEFATHVDDSAILKQKLENAGEITKKVLYSLTPEDLNDIRFVENKEVPVRWGILHIIDHTALHLGHMQITYQLFFGGKSKPSPFWYERLPNT